MSKRRIEKEIKNLDKDCPDGITVTQSKQNESTFDVTIIGPNDTAYQGGKFKLQLKLPIDAYPFKPPKIKFLTPIFHPKIIATTGKL